MELSHSSANLLVGTRENRRRDVQQTTSEVQSLLVRILLSRQSLFHEAVLAVSSQCAFLYIRLTRPQVCSLPFRLDSLGVCGRGKIITICTPCALQKVPGPQQYLAEASALDTLYDQVFDPDEDLSCLFWSGRTRGLRVIRNSSTWDSAYWICIDIGFSSVFAPSGCSRSLRSSGMNTWS